MALRALLRKELVWVRRNVVTLAFVLLLLPAAFAVTSIAFQQVIPRDAPVAVVGESDAVTDDELAAVNGVATLFSEPTIYDSERRAFRALDREDVYGVLSVEHGLFDANASVSMTLYVDEAIVPYEQPSIAITNVLRRNVGKRFPADVSVNRRALGPDRTLPEYLLPIGTMLVVMVFAFAYLPYNLARERQAFRRLRVETSLWPVLASKLLVFTLLMAVPIGVSQVIALFLGYELGLVRPGALGTYLLTFVYLTAVSMGIMFLTKFTTLGRLLNVVVLFGVLAFSSLVYPAGFFSPLRREIARLVPVHSSMIVARSVALKGLPTSLFLDHLAVLVGVTVLALAWLAGTVTYYERTV